MLRPLHSISGSLRMSKRKRFVAYLKRIPSDIRKLVREPLLLIGILLVNLFLFLFIVFPLFKIFQLSFEEEGQLSINVFFDLLSKRYNVQPLIHSLNLGVAVSILSTVIGFIFAYAVTRVDIPWKRFFNVTATFPIIAPPFMMSLSAILLFGKQGFVSKMILNGLIEFKIYGFYGLLVVETLTYFPTAYLTLYGVLQAIDPALEDAALDLGASKGKIFRSITLPLATPGIASAMLLVFSQSLADFGNPMILAGNYTILATQAYLTIVGMYDMKGGAALAILLLDSVPHRLLPPEVLGEPEVVCDRDREAFCHANQDGSSGQPNIRSSDSACCLSRNHLPVLRNGPFRLSR